MTKPVYGYDGNDIYLLDSPCQLGDPPYYLQEYVPNNRDYRIFVIGGEPVGAIMRVSDTLAHNIHQGGQGSPCEIDREMGRLAGAAARAVGVDYGGVDLLPCGDDGYVVLEVNGTPIFTIMAVSGVVTILHSFSVNKLGEEETNAHLYTQEGIEAVRSIKNRDWINVSIKAGTGPNGLTTTGDLWNFSGANDTKTKYTRNVTINSVYRDGAGNIIETGGTLDPDTLKVTSTVNWNFSEARTGNNISLVSYITNFRKAILSGGPIMMVYSKTTNTPFYRIWDGSSWSEEASAQAVSGNINYLVVKSSRTRNEANTAPIVVGKLMI